MGGGSRGQSLTKKKKKKSLSARAAPAPLRPARTVCGSAAGAEGAWSPAGRGRGADRGALRPVIRPATTPPPVRARTPGGGAQHRS